MNIENEKIIDVEISKEMRKSFLDYSMSVITSRALPDVRDGLKPVHRRILYTMFENNLYPEKAYRKCADTVGSVLGRYHPHGDASVYDAMVRMAQSFSMRYPLVDGHGNFGTIDGDPPAAYRYTESRMSKISMKMVGDIDKDTVDFASNYDDRLKEPTVLPVKFPNLLVNGSTGIAVGMATNIPPHNLVEVVSGMCALIDNPEMELDELLGYIKGPDFPTDGIIMGYRGIKEAYSTGRGKVYVRARAEIIESKTDRYKIVISELPYQVNKARLVMSIADLVKDKRIEGIADIKDFSNRKGIHIEIVLKRDSNAQVILNQLFKLTQMQVTFGVNMLALVGGIPRVLTIKQMLEYYIEFQKEVIARRTKFELKKAQDREHILEGLARAIDIVDEIIATIRACTGGQSEAKSAIMEKFDFDDLQASAIVAFRLGQLAGLEIVKIQSELAAIEARINEYLEILADEGKMMSIIKEEALAISEKFGNDRRTEIVPFTSDVEDEDLIPEEECMFTLTTLGYMKRQGTDTYRAQNRGGRGIMGMTRREEDVAQTMFTCSTHEFIMLFTSAGRVFRLKGYEIPEGSRTSKGMNVVNLIPIEGEEKVTAMVQIPKDREELFLCMVTKKGIIKRTRLDAYDNVRKNGIIAINLDEDDELAWVKVTDGKQSLLVATYDGMAICFDETDARPIGRTARGVKAIELKENDYVVGMATTSEEDNLLTVSETGYGRRSKFSDYRIQTRGGKGLINYRTETYGKVASVSTVNDDNDVIIISSDGIVIRLPVAQVSTFARPSKGVRVMKANNGEKVVTLSVVQKSELEDDLAENSDNSQNSVEPAENALEIADNSVETVDN